MYLEYLTTVLKELSGVEVSPFYIDESASLPAITYKTTGFSRNADSSLNSSELIDRNIQITIVGKEASRVIEIGELLTNGLEGYQQKFDTAEFFNSRVINEVDLFNHSQRTYEKSLDVRFTIKGIK